MKFILGLKLGMSQIFDEKGNVVPVTVIEAGPCQVVQTKTKEGKDGYTALQIGFKKLKEKKIKKTKRAKPFKYLREFRGDADVSKYASGDISRLSSKYASGDISRLSSKYKVGDSIDVSIFQEGDTVKISGISKGKGFAGVVKRWGFHGRPATHGTKHEMRTPGSVGSSFPERVVKGKKMPGKMGSERITVKNLKVVKVDKENNLLAVRGAVPGRNGTLLEIRE